MLKRFFLYFILLLLRSVSFHAQIRASDFDCSRTNLGNRPILSGRESLREEAHFIIHYSLEGHDASSAAWIDTVTEALNRSLDIQINTLGLALPPADCGEGGDERLDVYVLDMSDDEIMGMARPENIVGDNPNTEAVEAYAAYSYLLIENDLEAIANRQEAEALLRTIAAHEIHHNLQFGYDVNDRFFAFYEAGAAWIETLVYPEFSQLRARDAHFVFASPDECLGTLGEGEVDDGRIYGEWLLIDSLTRDLGVESYQFIWEELAISEGLLGFYAALETLGSSPETVILRAAVRNLLWDYELAEFFTETVAIARSIENDGVFTSDSAGVEELAVDYLRITTIQPYTISLLDGAGLELYALGINSQRNEAYLYEIGRNATVDFSPYSHAYLIILNTNRHSSTADCHSTDWLIQVSTATSDSTPIEHTGEVWNAVNFEAEH